MSSQDAKRVLIAEDNLVVGLDVQRALATGDMVGVGPCTTVEAARSAIENGSCDFAILDVELLDGRSFSLAHNLDERGVPYAFLTGRPDLVRDAGFTDTPVIGKPFKPADLVETVRSGLTAPRLQRRVKSS